MHDRDHDWAEREIEEIDFGRWICQHPSRSVTFIAPGGELFGGLDAPLAVEVLEAEPEVDPEAETVGDFDLLAPSGCVDLQASGGMAELTTIEVPPGHWRARWSGFGEAAAIEQAYPEDVLEGPDRPDRYTLQLWPLDQPRPVAVRRG